ncbi:Clathrin/coatomer adaptor, adaptin-like protein, partial [Phlyctochytrium arcticum]
QSLTDLIRGIRANKNNQDKYIATSLDEIRNEVRKNDPDIKALAVQKLTYLHMQGYDMTWASFHVIEVMSSPNIKYKRLGYQAAATSFRQDTDVLMLCTNLIKKDLSSNNFMESALALHGLASIVTPDLGRDLCTDLIGMLNHSRPYIRKRVILVLFRVFLKYPDALRQAYPRLKEKLDDPDPSVVCAAVNVICELARRNPKSYLPLAPQLYALLTNSGNNWMLIKIIKLFAALAPLEPRLIKKLVPKISNLIETTSAMSLLYECIHTVITGEMIGVETEDGENEAQDSALARLCTAKLKIFIEDSDQNLKYLGLYALGKLLKVRPKAVLEHRETVLDCLDDADVSIRLRALDIVTGMVTPANLSKIVRRLMVQLLPPVVPASDAPSQKPKSVLEASDRTEIIKRIVSICSKDTYAHVTNFDWYVETLTELVKVNGVDVGELLSNQLIDVAVRVQEVRELTVERMQQLLKSDELLATASEPANNTGVLCAAAWITGEYCQFLSPPLDTVSRLLHPSIARLDPPTQAVCIHNAFKIYAHWATADPGSAPPDCAIHTEMVLKYLSPFRLSTDLEVQERACNVTELLQLVSSAAQTEHGIVPVLNSFKILFEEEINPLAPKAQRRVLVPEGLNLDKWIYEPEPEQDEVEEEEADERWTDDGPRTYGRENEASIDPVEMERVLLM